MGALLSLPLLALPSMGTVRSTLWYDIIPLTTLTVGHLRSLMLWRGDVFGGLQRVWKVSEQASDTQISSLICTNQDGR